MTLLHDFARVSRTNPCPVCGKPDWCLIERGTSPRRTICARTPSNRRAGHAGWIHDMGPSAVGGEVVHV